MAVENIRDFNDWKNNRLTMNMGLANIKSFKENENVQTHPLNKIPVDRYYSNMELDKNSPLTDIRNRAGNINSTLSSINDLNDDINQMESLNAKINEELTIKERFTYSVLLKLSVIAFFVVVALATILINNEVLYGITFVLFLLALIINFSIMQ